MKMPAARIGLSLVCALFLVACGTTTRNDDGGGGGTDGSSSGTGGASAGTGGASAGTGGASAGTGGASAGTGGAGGASRGGGGAGGVGVGTMCASLLACCNAIANAQVRLVCMTDYGLVMSMGDAACGTALTQLRARGACP